MKYAIFNITHFVKLQKQYLTICFQPLPSLMLRQYEKSDIFKFSHQHSAVAGEKHTMLTFDFALTLTLLRLFQTFPQAVSYLFKLSLLIRLR